MCNVGTNVHTAYYTSIVHYILYTSARVYSFKNIYIYYIYVGRWVLDILSYHKFNFTRQPMYTINATGYKHTHVYIYIIPCVFI